MGPGGSGGGSGADSLMILAYAQWYFSWGWATLVATGWFVGGYAARHRKAHLLVLWCALVFVMAYVAGRARG